MRWPQHAGTRVQPHGHARDTHAAPTTWPGVGDGGSGDLGDIPVPSAPPGPGPGCSRGDGGGDSTHGGGGSGGTRGHAVTLSPQKGLARGGGDPPAVTHTPLMAGHGGRCPPAGGGHAGDTLGAATKDTPVRSRGGGHWGCSGGRVLPVSPQLPPFCPRRVPPGATATVVACPPLRQTDGHREGRAEGPDGQTDGWTDRQGRGWCQAGGGDTRTAGRGGEGMDEWMDRRTDQ